jgi:hypothetical protein
MATLTSNLPKLDMSTSTTGCCPVFNPADWDNKVFEFKNKPFIKDHTVSFLHVPLNMSRVMKRMSDHADNGKAAAEDFILLSKDTSPWHADHYYAIKESVPDAEIVNMSGKFYAKVYDGAFKDAGKWHQNLIETLEEKGEEPRQLFFYYTTCPKCAKTYGKNYVVGIAQIS